jgi:hypothetical protein
MVRNYSLAVVLCAAGSLSAQGQIMSNPVVTTYARYTAAAPAMPLPVAPAPYCPPPMVTYRVPVVAAPSCCTVAQPALPTVSYYLPTTTYRVPAVSAPLTVHYVSRPAVSFPSPTVMWSAPPTTVYRPWQSSVSAPTVSALSTGSSSSYYGPAASSSSPPVYAAPRSAVSGCACGGG